jgi:hypothetical protein
MEPTQPVNDPAKYLSQITLALISCSAVASYTLVRTWAGIDDGYIRIRATLINDDFLESAEYFILQEGNVTVTDYRHQWMNPDRTQLRRRWDSAPDHPELENYPHHVHIGQEDVIQPYHPISIIELLSLLERELQAGK